MRCVEADIEVDGRIEKDIGGIEKRI